MDETSKLIVKLFVPPSFEGVSTVAILEDCIDDDTELEVEYVNHLDFREYERFKETDVILVVGLPYHGYELPQDFYVTTDVPFIDFIHSSTYGEKIQGGHIISNVTPDMDPIKDIFTFIQRSPDSTMLSKHITITDKTMQMIEAVNAYRTWSWDNNGLTKVLLALYHAAYKRMPKMIRGLQLDDIIKTYAIIIKGQIEKMNDYIIRKAETAKTFTVSVEGENCVLKVVFADEYINELANYLLQQDNTSMPVIACVGRATKANDILSIRTRKVSADKVAYLINEGSGKDSVATVFSGVSYAELMGNAIVTALNRTF